MTEVRQDMSRPEAGLLGEMFRRAVDAVQPARCLGAHLPDIPAGDLIIIGAGKAAAAMTRVAVNRYGDTARGVVVTRYGHGQKENRIGSIDVIEAGHPISDQAGVTAANRILELVRNCGPRDLILCFLSGGGSALLSLPAPGLSLDDKQKVTRALIARGATIGEINCVRKHLSAVKGGRLAAAAYPAPIVTLAISDVAGDDPSVIASGPTVADPTTFADALEVMEKFGIDPLSHVARYLRKASDETPKPGDPSLESASFRIVADADRALAAAAHVAEEVGIESIMLGDAIEGEAREVARAHGVLAREYGARGKASVLLSGGETTVTIQGTGDGGPNTEYALALAIELAGTDGISAIACDTDGIDGSRDNAGAMVFPDTLSRARTLGLEPEKYLDNNDSYGFFALLEDLVKPGPTLTNVNDFRAILIDPT